MAKDSKQILTRVNRLGPGDSSRDIYNDWSQDYDTHLLDDFGYISPAVAAQTLAQQVQARDISIVDYGCGTGLVGMALRAEAFEVVDGIDISVGMLEQARAKGAYRSLICGDLTLRTALADEVYDVAICVGSMGAGHVGAEHIPELLRAVKPGGLFIITINSMHFEPEGFERAIRQMEEQGLWQIYRLEEFNYMTELDRPGWLLLAAKV